MGVERMLLVQQMQGASEEEAPLYDVFVATMGQAARLEGMKLVRALRERGLRADIDHACRSMKAQFKYAGKAARRTWWSSAATNWKRAWSSCATWKTASRPKSPGIRSSKYCWK